MAYFLDNYVLFEQNRFDNHNNGRDVPIYFALIAIGGGIGLFASYKMEKKWWDDNKINDQA
jgi:hypothetical protein